MVLRIRGRIPLKRGSYKKGVLGTQGLGYGGDFKPRIPGFSEVGISFLEGLTQGGLWV